MMYTTNKKKIILAILALVVMVLGVVSILVATRVSTKKAVAPTAPESKPSAFETAVCSGPEVVIVGDFTDNFVLTKEDSASATGVKPGVKPGEEIIYELTLTRNAAPALPATIQIAKIEDTISNNSTYVAGSVNMSAETTVGVTLTDPRIENTAGGTKLTWDNGGNGFAFGPEQVLKFNYRVKALVSGLAPGDSVGNKVVATQQVGGVETSGEVQTSKAVVGLTCNGTCTTDAQCNLDPASDAYVCYTVSGARTGVCRNKLCQTEPTEAVDCVCRPEVKIESIKAYADDGKTVISSLAQNQEFIYSIAVKNNGKGQVSGTEVTDVLNDLLVYAGSDHSGCSYAEDTQTVTCQTGPIGAGASTVVSFKVKLSADAVNGATISNTAELSYSFAGETVTDTSSPVSLTVEGAEVDFVSKLIYKDSGRSGATNRYDLSTQTGVVAQNEVFIYQIKVKNGGQGKAENIKITDILKGGHRDWLTYVDSDFTSGGSTCSFDTESRKVTCGIPELEAGASTDSAAFRVKLSEEAINGETVANTAVLAYQAGGEIEKTLASSTNLTVKGVVGCNETCASPEGSTEQCDTGLVCHNSKCRLQTNIDSESCQAAASLVCNKTCGNDSQCPIGMGCYQPEGSNTKYCRNPWCQTEVDCVCPVPTLPPTAAPTAVPPTTGGGTSGGGTSGGGTTIVTTAPTTAAPIVTAAPTVVATTLPVGTATVTDPDGTITATLPDGSVVSFPAGSTVSTGPDGTMAVVTPATTELPGAGLSLPGVAVFGGGLLLAILGILFAL